MSGAAELGRFVLELLEDAGHDFLARRKASREARKREQLEREQAELKRRLTEISAGADRVVSDLGKYDPLLRSPFGSTDKP